MPINTSGLNDVLESMILERDAKRVRANQYAQQLEIQRRDQAFRQEQAVRDQQLALEQLDEAARRGRVGSEADRVARYNQMFENLMVIPGMTEQEAKELAALASAEEMQRGNVNPTQLRERRGANPNMQRVGETSSRAKIDENIASSTGNVNKAEGDRQDALNELPRKASANRRNAADLVNMQGSDMINQMMLPGANIQRGKIAQATLDKPLDDQLMGQASRASILQDTANAGQRPLGTIVGPTIMPGGSLLEPNVNEFGMPIGGIGIKPIPTMTAVANTNFPTKLPAGALSPENAQRAEYWKQMLLQTGEQPIPQLVPTIPRLQNVPPRFPVRDIYEERGRTNTFPLLRDLFVK